MNEPEYNIYKLDANREKKLWEDAIIVFDSSALLDFYFLPTNTRTKVFDLFRNKLKNRLWLPSHVKFEYNKNREKVIKKPIIESYKPLKDKNLKVFKKAIKEIENNLADLKNNTKKDDKHPHLPQEDIDDFKLKIDSFRKESETFEDEIVKKIQSAEEEIKQLPLNDDVQKAIVELFEVGRYYSFSEVIEITKEGKHRYEYKVPPGYEDEKDKKGTQIFGDLIIWKQILEYAKEVNMPIIFICNDLKEDWCILEKNTTEKRIDSPREELLKEIYDFAEVDFWMYNQAQFLYKLNEYYDAEIEKQNIENLTQFLTSKLTHNQDLIFICDRCGKRHQYSESDIDLDFECVGSDERSMGTENEYQHTEYIDCEECGNEINVTFSVWEYPIGAHNYDDIDIDGATLVSCFDFSVDFHGEPEPDICEKCGEEFKDERNIGICDKCDEEYNTK